MSWENGLLMKLANDVENYEIEVTRTTHFFLTVILKVNKAYKKGF